MTATTTARYDQASADTRHERNTGHDALHNLEDELFARARGRSRHWAKRVATTIETFLDALDTQANTDIADGSLLSDIAEDHPRLRPRIAKISDDHTAIIADKLAISEQLDDAGEPDIDTIRNQISEIARRYRHHRSQEPDLVYEASNVGLGLGLGLGD